VAYIFGIVVVTLLFLSMHYFTELTKSQKAVATTVILAVVLGAIAYNSYSDKQREKMLNAVREFQQGKTVKCGTDDVNNTNFSLSIGTYTFIGKQNTPNFNKMISASQCE
jgi:hypothetical protein